MYFWFKKLEIFSPKIYILRSEVDVKKNNLSQGLLKVLEILQEVIPEISYRKTVKWYTNLLYQEMGVRYSSCQILWHVLDQKKRTQMFNFIQPGFYPIFQCKHKDFIGIWRSILNTDLNPQLLCIITHDRILNLCLECWA